MKCDHVFSKERYQTFANGTVHLRLECSLCGKLRRYLPQGVSVLETESHDVEELEQSYLE